MVKFCYNHLENRLRGMWPAEAEAPTSLIAKHAMEPHFAAMTSFRTWWR
jgi:hypothetical protein